MSDFIDLPEANLCTYSASTQHDGLIQIRNASQLKSLISNNAIDLKDCHVCSTGKNWGYGSRLSQQDRTTLLDLSQMKDLELNEAHGTATVEAGVTQYDLYQCLKRENSKLMLSLTGSSAHSSLLGNALGLGYGNGRSTVRIEDIVQLDGFLYSGQFIKGITSSTEKYTAHSSRYALLADAHSVITKAKFRLNPIPACLLLISFSIHGENQFGPLLESLFHLKNQGLILGNWSIFTAQRLLAEQGNKAALGARQDQAISNAQASDYLSRNYAYQVWNGIYNGVFACYLADSQLLEPVKNCVNAELQKRVTYLNFQKVDREQILSEREGNDGFSGIQLDVPILSRLRTFSGILRNGSMDIAYWKMNTAQKEYKLEAEGCGFIWLALSCPNDSSRVSSAKNRINKLMPEYGFDPIYVIDGVSSHECYIMISIIFNQNLDRESQKAQLLYKRLKTDLQKIGLAIYKQVVPFLS